MILTPLDEVLICELLALFHGDECLGTFTPFFVLDSGDTAFEDVWMSDYYGF